MASLTSILAALLFLCMTENVSAGDYTVAYALEVGDQKDAGKTATCEYAKPCEIVSQDLGLHILLDFVYPSHSNLYVSVRRIRGGRACCFFADGEQSFSMDPHQSFRGMSIFEGHARRRNEFIENSKLGTLYLGFTDLH
jgi:hypothetical protein